MASAEHKDFGTPDEVRNFEKARVELVNIGGGQVGRLTVEPGWRWSTHMKEVAGTELCEAPHFQYVLEGTVHVVMADGTELELSLSRVFLTLDATATGVLDPATEGWPTRSDLQRQDPEALAQDARLVGDEPVVTVAGAGASRWGGGA